MNYHKVGSPSPTQPRKDHGNGHKVSQRGLMSIIMLVISVGTLGIAMLGGAWMVYGILGSGQKGVGFVAPVIALGIAYLVGWFTAMVGIRVFGNLILPILINLFTWICLAGICILYIEIISRLFDQQYTILQFGKYVVVMIAALAAMVGLHLVIEDHNLRPFSLPLLIITMVQLGLIVLRYVFVPGYKPMYILGDLFFLFGMSGFSIMMLAHVGLLDPLRDRFTNYFDKNSKSIRTQD
jgi:hypothetical protein